MNTQDKQTEIQLRPINTTAAEGPKLGSWSYANVYEALYNKFSQYKNFNPRVWRDAYNIGEQDQYLSLLEINKDKNFSNNFYDPQYYDYEVMMLEMYLPLANKENAVERFVSEVDPVTQAVSEVSVGTMSDYDWISYQIDEARSIRAAEIQYQMELDHKNAMSTGKLVWNSIKATGYEFVEGTYSAVLGFLDVFGAVFNASVSAIGEDANWADAFVDYYAEHSLLVDEKQTLRAHLDEYERTHTYFRDVDGTITNAGTYLGGVANSIGAMIPSILVALIPYAGAVLGPTMFYGNTFSQSMHENATNVYTKNADSWTLIGNSLAKTVVEGLIEYGLGRAFGGTSDNALKGIRGKSKALKEGLQEGVETAASRTTRKLLSKQTVKKITAWTGFKKLIAEAGQEGLEEFLQDFATDCVDEYTEMYFEGYVNADGVTLRTLFDSFLAGTLSSIVMSNVHVAGSAIKSKIGNTKIDGTNIRKNDIFVETEAGIQKVRGYNRLWYSELVQNFNANIKKLSKAKFDESKNMRLAEETFAAYNALSQYYSQLSPQEIKNVEALLTRVFNREQSRLNAFSERYKDAASILSEETIREIVSNDEDVKKITDKYIAIDAHRLAFKLKGSMEDLIGELGRKALEAAKNAIDSDEDKFKKANVSKIEGVVNKDGQITMTDDQVDKTLDAYKATQAKERTEDVEKALSKDAESKLMELLKGYDYIILTDGHLVFEKNDGLFISKALLENYKLSDIYSFLVNSEVLATITTDNEFKPMFEEILSYYREFANDPTATMHDAAMNFFFNEQVYKGFLLSDTGNRLDKYKYFVFNVFKAIEDYIEASDYTIKKKNGEIIKTRANIARKILAEMKNTMRRPTLEAICTWGLDPQLVGADIILTTADKQLVYEYEKYKENLRKGIGDNHASEFVNLKENIINNWEFSKEELAAIERGSAKDATIDECLEMVLLLDAADENINDRIIRTKGVLKITIQDIKNLILSAHTSKVDITQIATMVHNISEYVAEKFSDLAETKEYATKLSELNARLKSDDISATTYLSTVEKYIIDGTNAISVPVDNAAFTIPYDAMSVFDINDVSHAQFVADVLKQFTRQYGVSARAMFLNELRNMTREQRKTLKNDMKAFDADNVQTFVIKRLEMALGDDYIVTPIDTSAQYHRDLNGSATDFRIARKIPAKNLVRSEFLAEDADVCDDIIKKMYDLTADDLNDLRYNILTAFNAKGITLSETELQVLDYIIDDISMAQVTLSHFGREDNGDVIDLSGEIITKNNPDYDFWSTVTDAIVSWHTVHGKTHSVEGIIDISVFPEQVQKYLRDVTISFKEIGGGTRGYFNPYLNEIVLDTDSPNYVDTIVHEFNHVLQTYYLLPGGGTSIKNKQLMEYMLNHYTTFVSSLITDPELKNAIRDRKRKKKLMKLSDFDGHNYNTFELYDALGWANYFALQGEIWARAGTHNGKPVHGFKLIKRDEDGSVHLLSPDRKTSFVVSREEFSTVNALNSKIIESTHVPKASPELAINGLYTSLENVLRAKELASIDGFSDNPNIRNTVHSRLTRMSKASIVQKLVKPTLSIPTKLRVTPKELILEPQNYLSDEILASLKGDYSEGNVYFRVKEYLEANMDGISIDRDRLTGEYVFVDDNAFDDLLKPTLQNEAVNFDDTTLYERCHDNDSVYLSTFYSKKELDRLGIPADIKVVINPNVKTQAVFNQQYPNGIVYIKADEHSSNAFIIDRLNHEFRHIVQRYNRFDLGFTMNFEVTPELLADVKAHAPKLFDDGVVKDWAKLNAKNNNSNWEHEVVRALVYYLNGGELHAYGINASLLATKPTYVSYEIGKPVIYLPWYDAKTGEGRHKTAYIAARADDTPSNLSTRKEREAFLFGLREKEKEIDDRGRYFNNKSAKGTNLDYFVEKGTQNQLDPPLQDFVKATTGHEDKIHPALMAFIDGKYAGKLTRQAFNKWFRKVDFNEINDFTFKLINKYIFKNNYITTREDLDTYLDMEPSFYWAVAQTYLSDKLSFRMFSNDDVDVDAKIALRRAISDLNKKVIPEKAKRTLLLENDVDTFRLAIEQVENATWKEQIKFIESRFATVKMPNGNYVDVSITDDAKKYMRIYAMRHFDGTLAGAFKTADAFRKHLKYREWETMKRGKISTDATIENKDGEETSMGSNISEADISHDTMDHLGNDILAIYENNVGIDKISDYEEMLAKTKYMRDVMLFVKDRKLSSDRIGEYLEEFSDIAGVRRELRGLTKLSQTRQLYPDEVQRMKHLKFIDSNARKFTEARIAFLKSLKELPSAEIKARHDLIMDAYDNGIAVSDMNASWFDTTKTFAHELRENNDATQVFAEQDKKSKKRNDIVRRIEGRANTLLNFINRKIVAFEDLPKEIQNMYEYKDAGDGKHKILLFKNSITSVGKGVAALPGQKMKDGVLYEPRRDLTSDTAAFAHDVSNLLEIERLLVTVVEKIKEREKTKKQIAKDAKEKARQLRAKNNQLKAELEAATKENKELNKQLKDSKNETTISVIPEKKGSGKNRVIDAPTTFKIISAISMPEKLKKIFDVSFSKFANTRVQFVSKDKDGRVYNKENMKPKEFESIVKHEVANGDLFFEAVRTELLSLTRQDVLNIIDFIKFGATTFDSDFTLKFNNFKIYLMAYFIEAARDHLNGWIFSEAQIDEMNKILERIGSSHGSGLTAIREMQKRLNPLKKVHEAMFDEWITVTPEDKEKFETITKSIQTSKNAEEARKRGAELKKLLDEMKEREIDERLKKEKDEKPWYKRWFTLSKIKRWRYMSMLSGPATWARNRISNGTLITVNEGADKLAGLIFRKKDYKKDQWDISSTKTSDAVKNFIEEYFKKNELFEPLYNVQGKYDERPLGESKKIDGNLLITMITKAYEREFAADNQFETKAMQFVSSVVRYAISDAGFVRYTTSRYFGKVLTIEVARGNVDLKDGPTDKVLNLFAECVIQANRDYMHKRSWIGDMLDALGHDHPLAHEVISTLFPFLNSSFNWFQEFLKCTPIGFASAITRMVRLEKEIAKVEAIRADTKRVKLTHDPRFTEYLIRRDIGKATIGTILFGVGILLCATGLVKFEEDESDENKYYIITKYAKIDISDIYGSSSFLLGAAVTQTWMDDKKNVGEKLEESIGETFSILMDGFFVNDIIQRHKWDGGFFETLLTETESVMRSFMPQFIQFFVSLTHNEKVKYSPGVIGMLQRWANSFVPFYQFGDAVINPYTGEKELKYASPGWIHRILDTGILGFKYYVYDMSTQESLCRDYEVNKNELTGELTVDGKKYTIDKETLNVYYGKLNANSLAKIKSQKHTVEMPNGKYKTLSWDQMSDEQRKRVINRTMADNAEIAKIYLWTRNGHKYYASESERIELRKLGITKNVYKSDADDKGFAE